MHLPFNPYREVSQTVRKNVTQKGAIVSIVSAIDLDWRETGNMMCWLGMEIPLPTDD
jgi:hypothetical protein